MAVSQTAQAGQTANSDSRPPSPLHVAGIIEFNPTVYKLFSTPHPERFDFELLPSSSVRACGGISMTSSIIQVLIRTRCGKATRCPVN